MIVKIYDLLINNGTLNPGVKIIESFGVLRKIDKLSRRASNGEEGDPTIGNSFSCSSFFNKLQNLPIPVVPLHLASKYILL
jgi:hypothetical protein